jgi:hypothetical protein
MFGLPIPISFYIYAALTLAAVGGIGYGKYQSAKYEAFKTQVETLGKVQEAKVESITKQQAIVTKGIENEYNAKLAAVRNYYKSTSVWNNPNSGKTGGISPAPSISDVITSYNVLAGQCAETTAQTVALQDWIKQQVGIK